MAKKKTQKKVALKRGGGKKISRRKRVSSVKELSPGVVDIDTFYTIANRIQLNREPTDITISESDMFVVENIMKDLEFIFTKRKPKSGTITYAVRPAPEKEKGKGSENVEELSDEILEEGQVLF